MTKLHRRSLARREAVIRRTQQGDAAMPLLDGDVDWFVAQTKFNQLELATICLRHKGFNTFMPLVTQNNRVTPMFGRYLFLSHPDGERVAGAIWTPGVLGILGGFDPLPLKPGVVDRLRDEMGQAGGAVRLNRVGQLIRELTAGDLVRISDPESPLLGEFGRVAWARDETVRIILTGLLGASYTIPRDRLTRIDEACS
jgi:hypothetical protein